MLSMLLTKNYTVGPDSCDCYGLCRPSSLLRFFQDIATEHATMLQIEREKLLDHLGVIWLLSRVYYSLDKPLEYCENFTLSTWPNGFSGPFFLRDFQILNSEGKQIGFGASNWLLYDTAANKIARPSLLDAHHEYKDPPLKPKLLQKIPKPAVTFPLSSRTAVYSDTDLNKHVNNTKYLDYACDALPLDMDVPCYAKSAQLNYSLQARPGQVIDHITCSEDGMTFVSGSIDGKVCYETMMNIINI